ncbi:MAG: virulence RhuM family protein [Bacteroidetes bacterium]|nr:virulence RhuM family protein [Bacteroidota bacterium]MBX7129009.1 virulence RhuM family protein [Flavobacteriales bacterium]MCC6656306.1 virulence RhuM family protein [Flavobacteriales bacterium]HMU14728.1 virulence RhuM family protein [Flavobacteriales bacterium]HMW98060.1 virulence RhuM family protein [Flavobacteriales bacterium]
MAKRTRKEDGEPVLLYRTEDGTLRMDVRMDGDTVWLSQEQMAGLFEKDKSTISRHIRNVIAEGELEAVSVIALFATTAADGKTYQVEHYNLDMIISVGYRVNSKRGTQFRIWATRQLREYLIKGFVLDDRRFKEHSALDRYFDELVERIRDIRTSERQFYRKVTDIYATSIDYEPDAEATRKFYATVQNKFHFAITGHTAAELIGGRASSEQPNMGLTNWPGDRILPRDVTIAKNYLNEDELKQLNNIVEQYLAFAESQALRKKPMRMLDWIDKLHGFLTLNEREVLEGLGHLSKDEADDHALREYSKYREANKLGPDHESDFDKAVKRIGKGKP